MMAPSYTIQGGTTQVLRGIVARGLDEDIASFAPSISRAEPAQGRVDGAS